MSIVVRELCFSYPGQEVLKNVSFSLRSGELAALLGENGAGKSTLFKCILGLLRGYTGEILIDGQSASGLTPKKLARLAAYIPQSHGQGFGYTVEDMVLMGTAHSVGSLSVPGKEQLEAARQAMERVGILSLAKKNYLRLSGGEQQLAMIARALAQRSRILIMDEPTSNLDYGNQLRVMEIVRSLADEGYSVLMAMHDPQNALRYADTLLALIGGEVEVGELTPELMRRLYGVSVRLTGEGRERLIIPN